MKGHPSGCGCVAAGLEDDASFPYRRALSLGALGLVGLAVVRRRRSLDGAARDARRGRRPGPQGQAPAGLPRGRRGAVAARRGRRRAARAACLAGGVAAFNEDKFTAGEVDVETIVVGGANGADDGPAALRARARRRALGRGRGRRRRPSTGWRSTPQPPSTPRASSSSPRSSTAGASCRDARAKQGFLVACDAARRARAARVDRRSLRVQGPRDRPRRRRAPRRARGPPAVVGGRRDRAALALRGRGGADRRGAPSARASRACGRPTPGRWSTPSATRDLGRALRTLADAYDPRDRGLPLARGARVVDPAARTLPGGPRRRARRRTRRRRRAGVFQPLRARELAQKARAVSRQGGGALDPRSGRDRPGAQELAPPAGRHPRGHAHAALPRRNACRASGIESGRQRRARRGPI